jgi:hypothetical protein
MPVTTTIEPESMENIRIETSEAVSRALYMSLGQLLGVAEYKSGCCDKKHKIAGDSATAVTSALRNVCAGLS